MVNYNRSRVGCQVSSLQPFFQCARLSALDPPRHGGSLVPLIPHEQVSILAGDSGVGKTTLLMQLLRAAQQGDTFCGFAFPSSWELAVISADRSWASIEETANRAGADLGQTHHRSLIDDTSISLPEFERNPLHLLCNDLIPSILPANLLLLDPLVMWLGVSILDAQRLAARLVRLSRLAKEHHLTIVGTAHAAAARTDYGYIRAQDRIAGSKGALLGFTSTQMFLDSPETTNKKSGSLFTWTIVSHHAAPRTLYLRRDEQGLFHPAPGQAVLDATSEDRSVDALLLELAHGATGASTSADLLQACEMAGFSRATLYRALDRLVTKGDLARIAHGQYRLAVTN